MGCAEDASWEADIIVLAVCLEDEKKVAGKIKKVATGKVVISMDFPGRSSSVNVELQFLLPHSRVIKALNSTFAVDILQALINEKSDEDPFLNEKVHEKMLFGSMAGLENIFIN